MPLDFPSSPSINDTYSYGDRTWIWNGSAWILKRQINDTPIGNSTPSTGAFTTLSSTGDTTLGNIEGNLIPAANITYNLGNSTNRWNDLWLANSTINIGNASISADGADLLLPSTVEIGNAVITESGGDIVLPAGTTVGGSGGGGLPVIANYQVTDSSWNVLDDTHVLLEGGYIIINGSGFEANAQVLIGNTIATSVSVVSSSVIRAQIPAKTAGSYIVYVANPDGGTGLYLFVQYSDDPNWLTNETLITQQNNIAISLGFTATDTVTYELQSGSSLPTGLSLNSNGMLTGTVTNVEIDTTYNFTVVATDAQFQGTPKAFSLTIKAIVPARVFVWGSNWYGNNGTPTGTSPVQLGTDSNWQSLARCIAGISAVTNGLNFTLGIKNDGTLWSWGYNANGQLGLGNIVSRSSPVQVGSDTTWSQASASQVTSFAEYSAIAAKYDGTIWVWGVNTSGYLGLGDKISRSSPTQIGTDTDWRQVSGGGMCLGAIKTDGTLWMWGDAGNAGSLGLGDKVTRSSPTQVGTDTDWKYLKVANLSSFALKNNGTLWAWGRNTYGMFGLGDKFDKSSPTQVGINNTWSAIDSNGNSAFAIRATDNTIWGAGDGQNGQLCTTNSSRSSPVQIGAATDWKYIAAGYDAAFATKTDNTLWGWGNNTSGQLGLGNTIFRSSPTQIGTAIDWITPYPSAAIRAA